MRDLRTKIERAAARAAADGRSVHHVSLSDADRNAVALPAITLTPAPRAAASVLWALDAKGWKLTPYLLTTD